MMFRFAHPVLLGLLAIVAGWLIYALRRKTANFIHSMTSALSEISGKRMYLGHRISPILRTACLILLVLASARPQQYNISRETRSSGVDIVLCLDTSGSMRMQDFRLERRAVSRLTAVKKVVSEFIKKRATDRIGLIVFGEEAFTQSPLTMDKKLLLDLVDKMKIGMAGDRTAIGSAIAIGGKRLKDLKAKSKILILLTDGRHNAGVITPEKAALAVRALEVKIYTIGVGGKSNLTVRYSSKDPLIRGMVPRASKGRVFSKAQTARQRVALDERILKTIAQTTGGKYFKADDSKQLSEIYDIIDREEKTEIKIKEFFHFRELYPHFLALALILFGLEVFLKNTFLRVIP